MKENILRRPEVQTRTGLGRSTMSTKPAAGHSKVLHSERYYGAVQRSFSLPSEVDSDKATASHQDGMLTLTLPRKTPNQSRKITVG